MGVDDYLVYELLKKNQMETVIVDYWKRIPKESFQNWYKSQSRYRTKEDRKKVEIYSYPVYNYKGHKDCMTLTIIGCEGRLIGGDVSCSELDGFMQGLMSTNKK